MTRHIRRRARISVGSFSVITFHLPTKGAASHVQETHFTDAFLIGAGTGNNRAKGPVEHTKIAVRITRRLKIALESTPKVFGGILGLTALF